MAVFVPSFSAVGSEMIGQRDAVRPERAGGRRHRRPRFVGARGERNGGRAAGDEDRLPDGAQRAHFDAGLLLRRLGDDRDDDDARVRSALVVATADGADAVEPFLRGGCGGVGEGGGEIGDDLRRGGGEIGERRFLQFVAGRVRHGVPADVVGAVPTPPAPAPWRRGRSGVAQGGGVLRTVNVLVAESSAGHDWKNACDVPVNRSAGNADRQLVDGRGADDAFVLIIDRRPHFVLGGVLDARPFEVHRRGEARGAVGGREEDRAARRRSSFR